MTVRIALYLMAAVVATSGACSAQMRLTAVPTCPGDGTYVLGYLPPGTGAARLLTCIPLPPAAPPTVRQFIERIRLAGVPALVNEGVQTITVTLPRKPLANSPILAFLAGLSLPALDAVAAGDSAQVTVQLARAGPFTEEMELVLLYSAAE